MIEGFLALLVSNLLSVSGLSATAENAFIYVPSIQHTFMVTLSCSGWVVIILQTFLYLFVMWIYIEWNRHSIKRKTFLMLSILGFTVFFLTNVFRIFTQIYLVGTVYSSVYQYYLLNWKAFEGQVGMGLMFAMLSVMSLLSCIVFKNKMSRSFTAKYPTSVNIPRIYKRIVIRPKTNFKQQKV